MKLLLCFLVGVCGFGQFATAAENKKTSQAPTETAKIMKGFLFHMNALKKFMVSEEAFKDPKNYQEILGHLKEFSQSINENIHNPVLSQDNFKFSWMVLQSHVAETERVFRLGNKSYARWMTNSTASVCITCHSQMPTPSRAFGEYGDYTTYASKFDQAEFLFATRVFDKSFAMYDEYIKGYDSKKDRYEQLQTALERQLAFYSRIKRDPEAAVVKFKSYQNLKNMPESLRGNIKAWISQFKNWSKQDSINPTTASEEQLRKFVEKNLDLNTSEMLDATSPKLVSYLRISGILFEYLQAHPGSKLGPELFYWLAVCDRSINHTFFFSLADMYLQECITRYPSSPVAKKCYKEYEDQTIMGYTGSIGTNIPAEVRQHLDTLKKLVDTGGKVDLKGH